MQRHVLIKIAPATKEDFSDTNGQKKTGQLYFIQSRTGQIERKAHLFNDDTDMILFKTLYAAGQIYVLNHLFMEDQDLETESQNLKQ